MHPWRGLHTASLEQDKAKTRCCGASAKTAARVEQLEVMLAEALQRRVLHMEEDFMVLDKPAGLPTQGGEGIDCQPGLAAAAPTL